MSTHRLPPLNALRAFEAAARLESFSRAAAEIHVTHGAVSHQVHGLEEFLGVRLFTRQGRKVVLTPEGKFLAERVRMALMQIGEAAQTINRQQHVNRLTISTLPSFAARWLTPRIGRFMELYPHLQVNIHSAVEMVDFARDEVDVALRFGKGHWPNVRAELVLTDEYFPVCSPRFNRGKLPSAPAELASLKLINSATDYWQAWFEAAGVTSPKLAHGPEYNDSSMLLLAAATGQGVALARRSLVEADLASGTLVRLFKIVLPSVDSYYLVWPQRLDGAPKLKALSDWLKAETQTRKRR